MRAIATTTGAGNEGHRTRGKRVLWDAAERACVDAGDESDAARH
jgi:hypothetical protein